MRALKLNDHLGHLVPRGTLSLEQLRDGLIEAMTQRRFLAGHGVPSVPTRFVVTMHPGDRAWFAPETEDILARTIVRHAERAGLLLLGAPDVSFACSIETPQGHPQYWAGFRDDDLLVLADPKAALDVFAARA